MTREEMIKYLEARRKDAQKIYAESYHLPDNSYNMGYFDMIDEILRTFKSDFKMKDVSKIKKLEDSKVDFEFSNEYNKMEMARNVIILSKTLSRVYSKVNELVNAINEERK